MRVLEVRVPEGADLGVAVGIVERLCKEDGLQRTVKGTSAAFPGSVHLHYKRKRTPGTLEITLWPKKRRIWLSVHENRKGSWTDESADKLSRFIERDLGRKRVES